MRDLESADRWPERRSFPMLSPEGRVLYRLLADGVVVIHLAFIAFAALGGLLALRHRAWLLAHAPAALWAVWVALAGRHCPLTPLENWLRGRGGEAGYASSFVEYYLLPVIYPEALTRELQIGLGLAVALLNALIYARVSRRRRTLELSRPGRP
jgi:hypothetical protein